MLDNLNNYQIILASNSPRRKELLTGLGVAYDIRTLPDIDESYPDTLQKGEIPLYIAREKAEAYRPMLRTDELMITADTIVWLEGRVLGKPKDEADAFNMLKALSGKTHTVLTGVCIISPDKKISFYEQTEVEFYTLGENEIMQYIASGEPMDKAGAYGIQEKGALFVKRINGDFYNVVGLPVARLARELKSLM